MPHTHSHTWTAFHPSALGRRDLFRLGAATLTGLTLGRAGATDRRAKSVVLLWMAGGPSQIDTFDPKPDRPPENRGPFGVTRTKLPGVVVCEHLPKLADRLDRFTILRSVDCRHSNHEPNTVMQTANLAAEPRTNPEAGKYPAIGSLVARLHGPNHPSMPAYAAFMRSRTHLAFAGWAGKAYDPFVANTACKLPVYDLVGKDTGAVSPGTAFDLPAGVTPDRLGDRLSLLERLDTTIVSDSHRRQAVDLVLGGRVRDALDLTREPAKVREAYGKHPWCQQALLARRLVEGGTAFVTIDLSYHTASGTWDTHGDNIPPYGGIKKGLGPLLPLFDHLVTTLVGDLDERGLLNDVLVMAMGEFGRTPVIGTQGSTDGRDHWPQERWMCRAGGGLRHGQVIGATETDGGNIRERPVTPGDLAATIFRYFGVSQDVLYLDHQGRPRIVVENHGRPLAELI